MCHALEDANNVGNDGSYGSSCFFFVMERGIYVVGRRGFDVSASQHVMMEMENSRSLEEFKLRITTHGNGQDNCAREL